MNKASNPRGAHPSCKSSPIYEGGKHYVENKKTSAIYLRF